MVANRKPTGVTLSMPAGLAAGGIGSLVCTLLGTAILAKLIDRGTLLPQNTGYGIMVILVLSAWTGAALAWRKIRRRKAMVCLLAGCVYYGTLLVITALFFGGQYHGAGETGLMILCGSILPILMPKPRKVSAPQRKIRIRNG